MLIKINRKIREVFNKVGDVFCHALDKMEDGIKTQECDIWPCFYYLVFVAFHKTRVFTSLKRCIRNELFQWLIKNSISLLFSFTYSCVCVLRSLQHKALWIMLLFYAFLQNCSEVPPLVYSCTLSNFANINFKPFFVWLCIWNKPLLIPLWTTLRFWEWWERWSRLQKCLRGKCLTFLHVF